MFATVLIVWLFCRFLLSLWPNLRYVRWPFRAHMATRWSPAAKARGYWRFMDQLNKELTAIQTTESAIDPPYGQQLD
jgi:hypothetical protein